MQLTGQGKIQTRPPTIRITAGLAKNILLQPLWHVARLRTTTPLQVCERLDCTSAEKCAETGRAASGSS